MWKWLAAGFAIVSCSIWACASAQTSLTAPTHSKCSLGVTSVPVSFPSVGGAGTLSITTSRECPWSITTDESWISISGDASGQGSASVPYAVAENPAPLARSGAVDVGAVTIQLNQAAPPCRFSLTRLGDPIEPAGGRLEVGVSTLNGCGWTATSGVGWITVVSGQEGKGSGTVALSVASNGGAARVATVNIADQTYTVTQEAARPQPAPAPPTPAPPAPAPPVPTPPAPTPPLPAPPAPAPVPTPPAPTPPSPTPPTPAPPTPTPPAPPPAPAPRPAHLNGFATGVTGRCPALEFTVSGTRVSTDRSTSFKKGKCDDLEDGTEVSVEGVYEGNVVKASVVEQEKKKKD